MSVPWLPGVFSRSPVLSHGPVLSRGPVRALLLGLGLALFVGLGLARPRVAGAQAPPGPMSRAHEDLGGSLECNNCHLGSMGDGRSSVSDDKCLSCHTHQPLRARIRAGKGFHAAKEVTSKACADCHPEHREDRPGSGRGRRTTIDWKPFGTLRNFDHGLVGWPLEGAHRYQDCKKCHTKSYPKTKLPSYLGLRGECTTCHYGSAKDHGPGGANPHAFTDQRLTDCRVCHGFSNRKVTNLGTTKFDHDKTAFPIAGAHRQTKCVDCHRENLETFKVAKRDFSDCRGCHEDAHRSVISAERKCASCHKQNIDFPKTRFDHKKKTGWPLRGAHQKNRCEACHKVGSAPVAPKAACVTCHKDIHLGRFGVEPCEGCHSEVGFNRVEFNHDRKTKFALSGKHKSATCTSCHRGGLARGFERFVSTQCADCHRHNEAHCGQFGLENCERCHVRGGDRTSNFDHSVTRFPLDRSHEVLDCSRCHKPAELGTSRVCRSAVKYTGLNPECAPCHVDMHKGELGTACSKCHTSGENFKTVVFDHDRDSRFPLTGYHGVVACAECHRERRYKLGAIDCLGCHRDDDVHTGRLGENCAKCHETTGGAPKFDHNVHTHFVRDGVHARIECERCHFLRRDEDSNPQAVEAQIFAATAPPGAPLDLEFRTAGTRCLDCHPDPHGVRADLDCAGCHDGEKWASPPRNIYHESVGFRLEGAHTVVACSLCHTGDGTGGSLTGRGERCQNCHIQDDVHAGSLGSNCGDCHGQLGWVPTTFTHVDTGYVLQGIHRALECRQCHQAGNYFISSTCYSCHLGDYRASVWHRADSNHQKTNDVWHINGGYRDALATDSFDCGRCHNQFSFRLGTRLVPQ
ncbi:MAG: cytochrome c3 family protein [Deltaproteobacteria bacterium]|nr:cytochrome c3 family protein [Deltaproteobacteria bacterium]